MGRALERSNSKLVAKMDQIPSTKVPFQEALCPDLSSNMIASR